MLGKGFVLCLDWLVARILDSSALPPPPPPHPTCAYHVSCRVMLCHVCVRLTYGSFFGFLSCPSRLASCVWYWYCFLFDVMSCHVMACSVMVCRVISCHVVSCHVLSCYAPLARACVTCLPSRSGRPCHVMSCHFMSCHITHSRSCYAMSCPVMSLCCLTLTVAQDCAMCLTSRSGRPCHVLSCHFMSCRVMSRHIMLRHVVSCPLMSCHVLSCQCPVMLGQVMSRSATRCPVISAPVSVRLTYGSSSGPSHVFSCNVMQCPVALPLCRAGGTRRRRLTYIV